MSKKILIADDQDIIVHVLSRFLASKGFDVKIAQNAEQCFERVSKESFDVIMLDVSMLGEQAVSWSQNFKKKSPQTELIFMSGQWSESWGAEHGFLDYLFFKKPFSLHAIIQTLQALAVNRLPKILVVDDQDFLREMLADYLKSHGFEISQAKDGKEALELAARYSFNAVLMDVRMPRLNGILTLKQMQEEGMKVPVILMSGFGDVSSAEEARALGARDFLPKPFKLENASSMLAGIA